MDGDCGGGARRGRRHHRAAVRRRAAQGPDGRAHEPDDRAPPQGDGRGLHHRTVPGEDGARPPVADRVLGQVHACGDAVLDLHAGRRAAQAHRLRLRAHLRLPGAERLHRKLPRRAALRRRVGRVGHEVHDDGPHALLRRRNGERGTGNGEQGTGAWKEGVGRGAARVRLRDRRTWPQRQARVPPVGVRQLVRLRQLVHPRTRRVALQQDQGQEVPRLRHVPRQGHDGGQATATATTTRPRRTAAT